MVDTNIERQLETRQSTTGCFCAQLSPKNNRALHDDYPHEYRSSGMKTVQSVKSRLRAAIRCSKTPTSWSNAMRVQPVPELNRKTPEGIAGASLLLFPRIAD